MVKKISDKSGIYHEPPYTEAEETEFYRRQGNIVGVFKSDHHAQRPAAVSNRDWICTKCKAKFASDQVSPSCQACGSVYVLRNRSLPQPAALDKEAGE